MKWQYTQCRPGHPVQHRYGGRMLHTPLASRGPIDMCPCCMKKSLYVLCSVHRNSNTLAVFGVIRMFVIMNPLDHT